MNRRNKISIAIMSALLALGATSTFARGPIAPAGPAASSSGIDLGQPKITPPAQARKELGSTANSNAATPAIPPSLPPSVGGPTAMPALPGNPTARDQVLDNRDAGGPQLRNTGPAVNAAGSGQGDLAITPSLPKDRYDGMGSGGGSMPSVGVGASTRSEIRTGRDAGSADMEQDASARARADRLNQNDPAVAPDIASETRGKAKSPARDKAATNRTTPRKNKSRTTRVN